MIYDEATINFIVEKVVELYTNIPEYDENNEYFKYTTGKEEAYKKVLEMLKNIKKIKAIN